jgi:hypothetical protein
VTEDAIRAELAGLRTALDNGIRGVREDVQAARDDASEGYERLRSDLSARLSDAVAAKVRIEILEKNLTSLAESRRFALAQVIAAVSVVVAVAAVVVAWVKP